MSGRARLEQLKERVEGALERLLPQPSGPAATIHAAMRYAVLGGGKRFRPQLALAACEACGGDAADALDPAAAIEMLHTYSLVHDDLPAMDDDDLRRGRPTVHRRFGEAQAILAGDALHTLAFEILVTLPAGPAYAERRTEAAAAIARAAGVEGMVGGQIADLEAEGRLPDAAGVEWIHLRKTAALISACAELGAILAGASAERRAALREFGMHLGLAFQITDDLLDRTASAAELGKTPGKDERAGKATYPAAVGAEVATRRASELTDSALDALRRAELDPALLGTLARMVPARSR